MSPGSPSSTRPSERSPPFSGALRALPQSGAWMETVKPGFGALLAAAALYSFRLALPGWPSDLAIGAALVGAGYWLGVGRPLAIEAPPSQRLGKAAGALA